MKHITFHLDFISPYAYLAFEQLPVALMGLSYSVSYKPVLLGAILRHHGQLGPAEIAAKRNWTYRHVQWLGHEHQVDLAMPAVHPFNPLSLLRLAIACARVGDPNRYVCETVLRHVWRGGADALDAARLKQLREQLTPVLEPDSDEVKARLRKNTDEAIAMGVFGVPAFTVDDKLFWGFDALTMLRNYLHGDAWFDGPGWTDVGKVKNGISGKH
jgi:2-hydroxychromene-2-carboxylate isomerase